MLPNIEKHEKQSLHKVFHLNKLNVKGLLALAKENQFMDKQNAYATRQWHRPYISN